MSHENRDLCSNPFVALFGSVNQVELYKTSIEESTKSGMCIIAYQPYLILLILVILNNK